MPKDLGVLVKRLEIANFHQRFLICKLMFRVLLCVWIIDGFFRDELSKLKRKNKSLEKLMCFYVQSFFL